MPSVLHNMKTYQKLVWLKHFSLLRYMFLNLQDFGPGAATLLHAHQCPSPAGKISYQLLGICQNIIFFSTVILNLTSKSKPRERSSHPRLSLQRQTTTHSLGNKQIEKKNDNYHSKQSFAVKQPVPRTIAQPRKFSFNRTLSV